MVQHRRGWRSVALGAGLRLGLLSDGLGLLLLALFEL